jgi:hypothetical protein
VTYVDEAVVEEEAEHGGRHPAAADPVRHDGPHDALDVRASLCVVPCGEMVGVGGVHESDEKEKSQSNPR